MKGGRGRRRRAGSGSGTLEERFASNPYMKMARFHSNGNVTASEGTEAATS